MGVILESGVSEVLLVLAALFAYLYSLFTAKFDYWKDLGVPFVKPEPFVGNFRGMTTFQKSAAENFMDLYRADELQGVRFAGAWITRQPVLMAIDPEFIKEILIKDFSYFSDRGLTFNEKKEPLNAHLFNLGGWRWRALRMRLSPTFTSGKMKAMYGTMLECADGLVKILEGPASTGQVIEIKEPLAQFTTDIIGSCAFGLQFNSMENGDNEFRKMGRSIFEPSVGSIIRRTLISAFPFLSKIINLTAIKPEVSKFFISVVKDTINERESDGIKRNDMMQLLLDIKKEGPIADQEDRYQTTDQVKVDESGHQVLEMTDELLAAQAFVFFLAGFETSSTTMSFALYELARNPEIQEKLAEDIEETIAKHNGQLTYDTIQDMAYLDLVIAETLRRYPPVGNLFRKSTKPYRISQSNVVLPQGMRVFIPVYAIHNDPKYYPDPDRFDPERFSPENKKDRHPMVYMPFGEGPRNCIGARFGLLQSKMGLATVVRKFKVEVCEKTVIPPKLDPMAFVTTIKGGINLKITRRT